MNSFETDNTVHSMENQIELKQKYKTIEICMSKKTAFILWNLGQESVVES